MMPSFLSDRRVLATSAAAITAAILVFMVVTYPTWRMAMDTRGPDDDAPVKADLFAPPRADKPGKVEPQSAASGPTAAPAPGGDSQSKVQGDGAAPAASSHVASSTDSGATDRAIPSDAEKSQAAAEDAPASPSRPAGGDQSPSFDVVRVEPTGDSVVAGRATPFADIVLLDQGQPIARAKADANGQVAFVPPVLAPGEHSLMLSVGEPDAPGALSSQSVAVSVSGQPKTAPMVALIAPDQPTRLLSGDPVQPPAASGPGAQAAPGVSIGAVDVEELGGIYATGRAAPNSKCRIYLNGAFVATVTAGRDGAWSLKIKRGMRPGRYTVRIDQIQSAAGQVQARAEVPFDYPSRLAGLTSLLRPKVNGRPDQPKPDGASAGLLPGAAGATASSAGQPAASQPTVPSSSHPASPAVVIANADPSAVPALPGAGAPSTVVSQLLTTKVVHGDSLWRISRKMLGHGLRYTQIYAANTTQIRDPKLIYPGQIFVMPQNTQ